MKPIIHIPRTDQISRWWILGLVLLLSACGEIGISPTQTQEMPVSSPYPSPPSPGIIPSSAGVIITEEVPMLPDPSPNIPIDQNLLSLAVSDLAQRLNVPPETIQLVKFEAVTWGDAGLGCPDPGMAYIQVPVDGALIVLQAGEVQYEYHSGGDRPPFLCEKNKKDPSPPPQIDLFNLATPKPNTPSTPDNSIPPGADK